MFDFSKLVIHSGGAKGSDYYFGDIGVSYGASVNHYYYKNKTPFGNFEINDNQYEEGLSMVRNVSKILGKNSPSKDYIKYLLARNWIQVKNSDEIYAIGIIDKSTKKKSKVLGGTGYAIAMVQWLNNKDKNLYVFDIDCDDSVISNWYKWDYDSKEFKPVPIPVIKSYNIAGIGTRKCPNNIIEIIERLFDNTISYG